MLQFYQDLEDLENRPNKFHRICGSKYVAMTICYFKNLSVTFERLMMWQLNVKSSMSL